MDASGTGNSPLQQGIAAAKAKRKDEAYGLLRQAVQSDSGNIQAWIWLGAVAPTPEEQLQAFQQALELDPSNEKAQAGRRLALGRLGGAAAAAAPPPAPAGGGLSSQDMMGMFGGAGAAASPPPAGSLSSQDMMGMFGPSPLAGQVPGLGPVTPPRPEGSPRGPETPPPPRAMPPGPPTPPPPRPMSEQATRPTPPDPTGIFGPAPTPGGLPPGAAGTPGGAEWRGQSELDNTAPFQWDDPGLGLGGAAAAPAPSSSDNDWLNAPSGAAASFAAPAPSTESGFTYAPPTGGELGSRPLTSEASASPIPMAPEAPRTLPPAQPAKSGGISPTGLLLGVALVVIAILLALAFFRSPLFLNNNRSTPPETSVRQFLNAHFAGKWSEAAGYLASDQAAAYTADHQFAGLPTKAGGPVSTKGLAVDDPNAEVYATVPPAVKPYLFHLQKGADRWLITSGLPPAQ